MPNATSKDWDKHNLNEMDRRHREAELRGDSASDRRKESKAAKKRAANRNVCMICRAPIGRDDFSRHYREVHMRKRSAPSKRIRKITPKGNEKPRVTKDLQLEYRPATSIRTLAERMKTKTLARYLLKLAKSQGLEIEDVNQSLEMDVAEKILSAFK